MSHISKLLGSKKVAGRKMLAIFLAALLVFPTISFSVFTEKSFADETEKSVVDAPTADKTTTQHSDESNESQAGNDEIDISEIEVVFTYENAYASIEGQVLVSPRFKIVTGKEFTFEAHPETGFELSDVTATNDLTQADIPLVVRDGVYVVESHYVDAGLRILLKATPIPTIVEEDKNEESDKEKNSQAAVGAGVRSGGSDRVVYWNPTTFAITDPADDNVIAPAGSDSNSGGSAEYPVLTWDRVKDIISEGEGYTVYIMTTAVLGSVENNIQIVPDELIIDGAVSNVTLTYWEQAPEELFQISLDEEDDGIDHFYKLSLKDVILYTPTDFTAIRIVGADSVNGRIHHGAQLEIGQNVIIPGIIQTELSEWGHSVDPTTLDGAVTIYDPIKLTGTLALDSHYQVYYSGINENLYYQRTTVIDTTGSNVTDAKDHFTLSARNTAVEWKLLWENEESESGAAPDKKKLALARDYEYEAVYLNGQKGNDGYFGGNCAYPVKTFEQAKKLLKETNLQGNGIIYVCDTVDISGVEAWSLPASEGFSEGSKVVVCPDPSGTHDHSGTNKIIAETMVHVKAGGSLSLEEITLEYSNPKSAGSSKIVQLSAGGSLDINEGTVLTGGTTVTRGYAVMGLGSAEGAVSVTMNGGLITNRTYGISVQGFSATDRTGALLKLYGGEISGIDQGAGYIGGVFGAAVRAGQATVEVGNASGDAGPIIANNSCLNTTALTRGAAFWLDSSDFTMTAGVISKNKSTANGANNFNGGAIYAKGSLVNISGGSIVDNEADGSYGRGGALYADTSTINISGDAIVSRNTSGRDGGALYFSGKAELHIADNPVFEENKSKAGNYGGGALHVEGAGRNQTKVFISGGTFVGNTAADYGGAVSSINTSMEISGGLFQGNKAKKGGAHYMKSSTGSSLASQITITGGAFKENEATVSGGALTAEAYVDRLTVGSPRADSPVLFEENTSAFGGAVYVGGSARAVLTDYVVVTNNTAETGGGVAAATTSSAGRVAIAGENVVLKNNVATGSITQEVGSATRTFVKGSNLYASGTVELLGGSYSITDSTQSQGAVFVDINPTATYRAYIDPTMVAFENNDIFLNSVQSRLWALKDADDNTEAMPISVNSDEVFDVGSIVVTPITTSYSSLVGQYQATGFDERGVSHRAPYFSGGKLPYKTQLGGFKTDVIIVGEGVYLDGESGDDGNNGTSPTDAVQTWERAKSLLGTSVEGARQKTEEGASEEELTFNPYIYICGEVPITQSTTWHLYDPNDVADVARYKQERNELLTPEVRRFASYYGKLVNVKHPSATFTVEHLVMNGVAENVAPLDPSATSSTQNGVDASIDVAAGNLTLTAGADIQNNFQHGIRVNGFSSVVMLEKNSKIHKHRNIGLYLAGHDIAATMTDQAVVSCEELPEGLSAVTSRSGIAITGSNSILNMIGTSKVFAESSYGIINNGATVIVGEGSTSPEVAPQVLVTSGSGIALQGTRPKTYIKGHSLIQVVSGNAIGADNKSISNAETIVSEHAVMKGMATSSAGTGVGYYGYQGSGSLHVKDTAVLENFNQAVRVRESTSLEAKFSESAGIRNSMYGFYVTTASSGAKTSVDFFDDSYISNTYHHGFYSTLGYLGSSSEITQLTLHDRATIDGTTYPYANTIGWGVGFYDQGSGAILTLNDESSIKNMNSGAFVNYNSSNASYNRGTGQINMNNSSSIEQNNTYGVCYFAKEANAFPHAITLSDSASIRDNGYQGIYGNEKATISVGPGTSIVNNAKNLGKSELGNSIYSLFDTTIDVNATIDDEVYLARNPNHITLTNTSGKVIEEEDKGKFKLGYAENYVGEKVVSPDEVSVSDAADYFDLFQTKNIPTINGSTKGILAASPYIVVQGENNVYLAGDGRTAGLVAGDDNNSGAGPGSPVRTFARAKELLAEREKGANIVICNYPVSPYAEGIADETEWSFDEGGAFTNDAGDTWTPLVTRHTGFTGNLIDFTWATSTTPSNYVFTLKNLTFDGMAGGHMSPTTTNINVLNCSKEVSVEMDGVVFQNFKAQGLVYAGIGTHIYKNITVKNNAFGNAGTGSQGSFLKAGNSGSSPNVSITNLNITENAVENTTLVEVRGGAQVVLDTMVFESNTITNTRQSQYGIFGTVGSSLAPVLTIKNSLLHNNDLMCSVAASGGLITAGFVNSKVALEGTRISNNDVNFTNTSTHYGGIVNNYGGTLDLIDSHITENEVAFAGSYNYGPLVTIRAAGNSSFSMQGNSGITQNKLSMTRNTGTYVYGLISITKGSGTPQYSASFEGGVIGDNQITHNYPNQAEKISVRGAGLSIDAPGDFHLANTSFINNKAPLSTSGADQSRGGALYLGESSNTIITGGVFSNNQAPYGSAIYLSDTATLSLGGGTFTGNTTNAVVPSNKTADEFEYAAIYVRSPNFALKGGRAVVDDHIFLSNVKYSSTLSGSIYQKNRTYNIDVQTKDPLSSSNFKKGSVVIKPDGDVITNTTSFFRYFKVGSPGYVLAKQSPNLVLKAYAFLDSTNNEVPRDGSNPERAFRSLDEARAYFSGDVKNTLFFVSGPLYVKNDETWSLHDSREGASSELTSEIIRYAGFSLTGETYDPYLGDMFKITNDATLTFEDIDVMGRRDVDSIEGGSIVHVGKGSTFNMGNNTTLSLNTSAALAQVDTNDSQGRGGAIFNEGTTNIKTNTASISSTAAAHGGAIYQNVDNDTRAFLNLSNRPYIEGSIYLMGTKASKNASGQNSDISVDSSYIPPAGSRLAVDIKNTYNGREVIDYTDNNVPGLAEKAYYRLTPAVSALYALENRAGDTNILELQQKAMVYIDGQTGDDLNDGGTPLTSVRTFKRAYEVMKLREQASSDAAGGVIYVVDTVDFSSTTPQITMANATESNASTYTDSENNEIKLNGTVSIRRYAQPTAYDGSDNAWEGYDKATHFGALLDVQEGGSLTVKDMTIEGHSEEISGVDKYAAVGVEAISALISVTGGTLAVSLGEMTYNNNVSTTAFGGAVNIQSGTATLADVNISNTRAIKGSAVYQGDTLNMSGSFKIKGEIYLAGSGSQNDPSSSCFINVLKMGIQNNGAAGTFEVMIEDPYYSRQVVAFPLTVPDAQRTKFTLDNETRKFYSLMNRVNEDNILELRYRTAVYIDGQAGNDANNGLTADTAVATLAKAYEVARNTDASVLYVVDTVDITSSQTISPRYYVPSEYFEDGSELPSNAKELVANTLEIRRYSQPNDTTIPGFSHESNTKALFAVSNETFIINGMLIDGHKSALDGTMIADSMKAAGVEASAPLIATKGGNTVLQLNEGTILQNNRNVSQAMFGGAVANYATTVFNDASFVGNETAENKASGIYQHGIFNIESIRADSLQNQEVYLASSGLGVGETPVDYQITVSSLLPDNMVNDAALLVNLDNAVRGRNIANFVAGAFDVSVGNEYDHFKLGSTVPSTLQMEVSPTEINTIELQGDVEIKYEVVTFDKDDNTAPNGVVGGTVSPIKNDVYAAEDDASKAPLSVPTANAYYVFVGWFLDAACEQPVDSGWVNGNTINPVKEDGLYQEATYYAKFIEETAVPGNMIDINYEVLTVNTDGTAMGPEIVGGTLSNTKDTISVLTGTILTGSTATANTGFKFAGWYDAKDASASLVESANAFVPTKPGNEWKNATYYAKFVVDDSQTVRITYAPKTFEADGITAIMDVDGGSVSPLLEDVALINGNPSSAATANPGYKFVGWYSDPACENEVGTDNTYNPAKVNGVHVAAPYYAKFVVRDKLSYKVEYYFDGTKDDALSVSATGTLGNPIPYDAHSPRTHQGNRYVLDSVDGAGRIISIDESTNIVRVYYRLDEGETPTAPEIPTNPTNPTTPTTPGTPGTPVTPGTLGPQGPVTTINNTFERIVERIAENLPEPITEALVGDNETPLAGGDERRCWVHWFLGAGALVMGMYTIFVLRHRRRFTKELDDFDDRVMPSDKKGTSGQQSDSGTSAHAGVTTVLDNK